MSTKRTEWSCFRVLKQGRSNHTTEFEKVDEALNAGDF